MNEGIKYHTSDVGATSLLICCCMMRSRPCAPASYATWSIVIICQCTQSWPLQQHHFVRPTCSMTLLTSLSTAGPGSCGSSFMAYHATCTIVAVKAGRCAPLSTLVTDVRNNIACCLRHMQCRKLRLCPILNVLWQSSPRGSPVGQSLLQSPA